MRTKFMHSGQAVTKSGRRRPNGPILAGEANAVGITTGARRTACGVLNEAKRVTRSAVGPCSDCKVAAVATGRGILTADAATRGAQSGGLLCRVGAFRLRPNGRPVVLKTKLLSGAMRGRGIRTAARVTSVLDRYAQAAGGGGSATKLSQISPRAVCSPISVRRIRRIISDGLTFRRRQRRVQPIEVMAGNFAAIVSQKGLTRRLAENSNSPGGSQIHAATPGRAAMREKAVSRAICGRMEVLTVRRQTTVLATGG